jgi:hypothetical protein
MMLKFEASAQQLVDNNTEQQTKITLGVPSRQQGSTLLNLDKSSASKKASGKRRQTKQ